MGSQRVRHDWAAFTFRIHSMICHYLLTVLLLMDIGLCPIFWLQMPTQRTLNIHLSPLCGCLLMNSLWGGWGSLGPLNSNPSILFLPKEAMRMAHGVKLVCYVGFCFLLLLFFLPLLRFGGVGAVLPRDNPSPSPLPSLFQSIPTPYDVNLRLPFSLNLGTWPFMIIYSRISFQTHLLSKQLLVTCNKLEELKHT